MFACAEGDGGWTRREGRAHAQRCLGRALGAGNGGDSAGKDASPAGPAARGLNRWEVGSGEWVRARQVRPRGPQTLPRIPWTPRARKRVGRPDFAHSRNRIGSQRRRSNLAPALRPLHPGRAWFGRRCGGWKALQRPRPGVRRYVSCQVPVRVHAGPCASPPRPAVHRPQSGIGTAGVGRGWKRATCGAAQVRSEGMRPAYNSARRKRGGQGAVFM